MLRIAIVNGYSFVLPQICLFMLSHGQEIVKVYVQQFHVVQISS